MAFNFPNDPAAGQDFTPSGGPTYTWDGLAWRTTTEAGGTFKVIAADTPPIGAATNTLWWCTLDGTLAINYDDGDSVQWVTITAGGTPQVSTSSEPPTAPLPGQIWWDPDTGLLMIWYVDGSGGTGPSGGVWVEVAQSEGGGGGASITVQDDPPAAPGNNALWWSSKTGQLALWYNDGNTRQWVVVAAVQASPYALSARRISEGMQVLTSDAISFEVVVPPNAKIAKMILVSAPATAEGYPTLIFMKVGVWQTTSVYVNANINRSGTQALMSDAGSPGTCIFLGNQANQNVPTVVDMTFSFVGQPQVIATQSAYSSAVGQSIGVRSGIGTSGYVPERIGFQVSNGAVAFASGSCLQYEFWG